MQYKKSAVDLTDLAIGIVVLGIVVSVGATILINVRDTNISGTAAYNVSDKAAASGPHAPSPSIAPTPYILAVPRRNMSGGMP